MNYIKLVARLMRLTNFKNKYGRFVKDISEQMINLVKKELKI